MTALAMPETPADRTDWVRNGLARLMTHGKVETYSTKGIGRGWRWCVHGSGFHWYREFTQKQAEAFVLGALVSSTTYREGTL